MSEIFNLSDLCRCCHSGGSFKSLNLCYSFMGQVEVYANMLHEAFGLILQQPSIEASYSICDICIIKLRYALKFKRQVLECEMKFEDYCKNEMALQSEVIQMEHELCSDKMILTPDVNIKSEDLSSDSHDSEDAKEDYADLEVCNNDYIGNNEEKIINTEYPLNERLEKQQFNTANTEIQRNFCLEKLTSGVSKVQKNVTKEILNEPDLSDDSQDNENTYADYADEEVPNDDYIGNNEDKIKNTEKIISTEKVINPKKIINTEKIINECLEKEQTVTANTKIQNNVCLEKEKTVKTKSKIQPTKSFKKRTSCVSKVKSKQKNIVKKKATETGFPKGATSNISKVKSKQKNVIKEKSNEPGNPKGTTSNISEVKSKQKNVVNETKKATEPGSPKGATSDASKVNIKQKNVVNERLHDPVNLLKLRISLVNAADTNLTRFPNPKVYVCQTCKNSFQTAKILKEHLRKQHSIFRCRICKQTFNTKKGFTVHTATHRDEIFECDICSKRFLQRPTLVMHRNTHTKETVFTCDLCKKDFLRKSVLKKHIDFHLGKNKKFKCDLCGHSFNDTTNLKIHVRNVHEKLRLFKCDQCPKTYATNKTLRIHLRKHTGERPYKCQVCDKAYTCKTTLIQHTKRTHSQITYVCEICGKYCKTLRDFDFHTKTHNRAKSYKCDYCDQDYSCRFSLNRHIKHHVNTLEGKGSLPRKRHVNAHEVKVKKFPCEICFKKFAQESYRDKHMKTIHGPNTEVKKKCNLCKMSVRNMEKHMKSHTDRPLLCSRCPRTYSETSVLNRHFREIHCGITYDCDLCDKKYVTARNLQNHKLKKHKTHTQFKVEQEDAKVIERENNTLAV